MDLIYRALIDERDPRGHRFCQVDSVTRLWFWDWYPPEACPDQLNVWHP